MRSRIRNTATAATLLAAFALAISLSPASAQGRGGGGGSAGGSGGGSGCGLVCGSECEGAGFPKGLIDRLDLTDEQKTKMETVREAARTEGGKVRKELMRLHHEMRGLMLEDDINASTARELTEKIGELRTKMQLQRLETRLAMRELLTEEQRDQMLLRGPAGHGPRGPEGCRSEGPRGPRSRKGGHGRRGPRGRHGGDQCVPHPGCEGSGPRWQDKEL